ncbi:MAG: response regulator transcription factor [Campylobacterota bacterium]|nr:response regulator transcription factor [Campylobacterota bacterium]
MRILLLEDDIMLNSAIVKYLETTGHKVESFREGEGALEAIKSEVFDLLVLDINVPGIDGFTLLEQVYENKTQIPAIFISALVDIEEISRAFELGCYDYLKKPFHLKELGLRISKMLQSHQLPQEHTRLSSGYSYNMTTSVLYFYNEPQVLPNRQLQIITVLAKNRGTVVGYDTLRDHIWNDYNIDKATICTEVNRLKKNLREDFVINIRSIGYMIKRVK